MTLTSDAFTEGQPIPRMHTCDGADASPPLSWSDVPSETKSFALLCEDPDATHGTFVHWVLHGLPASERHLPSQVSTDVRLPDGTGQGLTDFGRTGYGGPCPPPGKPHRYFFRLFALDTVLALGASPTRQDLVAALENHVLAEASLMGRYQRQM